ncbi:16S rRNA (guanine527-N7)-methyltransferase [Micromonospora kangleipakensis]|uniref:Ribosomal RNA small subunit methyltransferase G n=1 Tax=Micromonospora kangleipakensis TaxID=1077942 RepID=A0A4V2GCL3_9ACTN|nr:16S rRNA (guanine527-N7)-methyltransferase [Micromonospora kangleipakensis]
MTHDETTAGAVSGPGGTPSGPSPVRPELAAEPGEPAPLFSDATPEPATPPPGVPAVPADAPFSGTPSGTADEPAPAAPAGSAEPAFSGTPTDPADPAFVDVPVEPAFVDVPAGAVDPAAALADATDDSAAVESEGSDERSSPAEVTLPPELAEAARTLFGDRLDLAAAYAELLATDGVVRGLIGPREAPRIWERHLLNCAAMAERIPEGATVLDVGSGAGLPGLVLAIARPDLTVTLIEPLARRTSFLIEAVQHLGLTRMVRVFRGRADEAAAGSRDIAPLSGDIVTARAVAPLDRLAAWCLPLVVPGGRLVALKGATAADEVAEHAEAVTRLGGGQPEVHRCGVGVIEPPATVIEVVRERVVGPVRKKAAAKRSRGGRRGGRGGRDR